MRMVYWLVRFLIPFAVLYTIGYYVPGFSALTISWIAGLSFLIMLGDWLAEKIFPMEYLGKFQDGVINFLVSTVVIFTATWGIQYGNVPLSASLLAALIIGILMVFVPREEREKRQVSMEEA